METLNRTPSQFWARVEKMITQFIEMNSRNQTEIFIALLPCSGGHIAKTGEEISDNTIWLWYNQDGTDMNLITEEVHE